MLYLRALLAWKQHLAAQRASSTSSSGDTAGSDAAALLDKAVQAHMAAARRLVGGEQQLAMLHPSRLLALARLVMSGLSGEPRAATEAPSPLLAMCIR